MLRELRIENFILISKLHLEFNQGLNIFTGETGAGKSMIIGAINVGLGEKANADSIRNGADKAEIQLVFELNDPEIIHEIKELGVDIEDGILIITRILMSSNRSTIRMNDRVVTLATLKEVSKVLIDVHGQHAHQGLLYPKNHLKYLDMIGDADHHQLIKQVETSYFKIKDYQQTLEKLVSESPDFDPDYLIFQINEIDALDLKIEEEESLNQKYEYYKHLEMIHRNVSQLGQLFSNDDGYGIKDMIQSGIQLSEGIHSYDDKLNLIHNNLHNMLYNAEDISREIRHFVDQMEVDEEEMSYVEERMNAINSLKMKHGKTITDILEKRNLLFEQFSTIENRDEKIQDLEQKLLEEKRVYLKAAKALNANRLILRDAFVKSVTKELVLLNMKDSHFDVVFNENKLNEGEYRLSPYGLDQTEFYISTNPGMPLGPIAKIASGGEMSRIMLAIKLALANQDTVSTLVFDEVDTGISGQTALVVAEKLYRVSTNYQVLCITHLPQIAAISDQHYLIHKNVHDGVTETSVKPLNQQEKQYEVARILSGQVSEVSLKNAEEMVSEANKIKLS